MRMSVSCFFLIALSSIGLADQPAAPAKDEARLLRFPTIHGNHIVFTYAGDLYTVAADGGIARRLTSHDGFEMFARFSPDGKWIAFTGQYDGNTEVYVMPADGGVPKRLTYTATLGRDDVSDRMGPNNIVMGWKNDSKTHRLPLAHALVQRLHRPALHGLRSRAACRSSCRCRAAASAPSRPTTTSWPTTASSASSAPGSATAAAWPTTSGSTISRPRRPTTSPTNDAAEHHPDVGRQQDLLPLRPRCQQADEPLRLRPARQDDAATDQLHATSTSSSRPSATRPSSSRTAARSTGSTWPPRRRSKVPIRILEDRAGARRAHQRQQERHQLRDRARRQTRPVRGPRRGLHRAGQGRADAQPHQHARRPRTQLEVVARRQVDRLRLRRQRRGRDLRHRRRTAARPPSSSPRTADTYKYDIAWSPDSKKILWTDKKLRCPVRRRGDQEGHARSPRRRPGRSTTTSGRPTASGSPMSQPEPQRPGQGLALLASNRTRRSR